MNIELQIKGDKIYSPIKGKWLVLTPEERVRQEYICRLVNHYGFEIEQMDQEVQVSNSHRGQGQARADIVIWKSRSAKKENAAAVIVIECKAEHITIHEEDYFQGHNYAAWSGADFFVTTNLKETRVFKVDKDKLPKTLEEIVDIPIASELNNSKRIKEILNQTKTFTLEGFKQLLTKCHNIIRNNDKLSPEAAFDEVSKIMFMKIWYERKPDGDNIFSLKKFKSEESRYDKEIRPINVKRNGPKDDIPYMNYSFERIKPEFNDILFNSNDSINIKQASFEAIVKELEIYNLSRTSDDVKGIAFENFLGKTFRGELGQYFTPRTVVDFMVELLDPEEGELICDPCCGSGGFLIKAFEYVREKIETDIQKVKERFRNKEYNDHLNTLNIDIQPESERKNCVDVFFSTINQELDTTKEGSRLHNLSHNCIFGTDANPRMARTAKMNMIMHGDGHGGVHHHDGLLNVNGIFENRFDVILTNPPFGSRVEKSLKITENDKFTDDEEISCYTERYGTAYIKALEQVNNNIGKSVLSIFESGKLSGLTEVLFIERCIRLLKPGGRMGIVLPEGVLNNPKLHHVRELFESMAKIILITSIPQDVFMASGATVKPSLVFFKKFTEDERNLFDKIQSEAKIEIYNKYSTQINEIDNAITDHSLSAEKKKKLRVDKKALEDKMKSEIWTIVKTRFDYTIPIAQVQKAGITTTGAECENELTDLLQEYTPYREEHNLWMSQKLKYDYNIIDGRLIRINQDGKKIELC